MLAPVRQVFVEVDGTLLLACNCGRQRVLQILERGNHPVPLIRADHDSGGTPVVGQDHRPVRQTGNDLVLPLSDLRDGNQLRHSIHKATS